MPDKPRVDFQLKALLHQHIIIGVQSVVIPLKPSFSHLVGNWSDAVLLPDVVGVGKASDTSEPMQHLWLHDPKVMFSFFIVSQHLAP